MIKMQILMNNDKIIREKKYDLEKIYTKLDSLFIDRWKLLKGENGFYFGKGSSHDFAHFGLAMMYLEDKDWFMDNVDTWLYFNSDDSDDPNDFVVEDFKEYCSTPYSIGA